MPQLLPDNLPDPILGELEQDDPVEYGSTWEFHFGTGCGCDSQVYGPHLVVINNRAHLIGGKNTLKQWLAMTLATERFEWLIYDGDYGTEFNQIIASSPDADEAITDIEQTLLDALLVDDRIREVTSVDVEDQEGDSVTVEVRLVTFAGDIVELFHDIGGVEDV